MENKSLKRGSVSKDRNVGAKRRRVTIVEKDISPNLYDQNVAMVEKLMQKCIKPMMTELMTNVMSSLITSQLVSNRSTYKSTSDDGDVSIIPSPEVETIDIIDVKEEISIKNEPENPIVIIDEHEESIKNELTLRAAKQDSSDIKEEVTIKDDSDNIIEIIDESGESTKNESKETLPVQRVRKSGRTPIAAKQGSIERKIKKEKDDHTSTNSEESIGGKDDSKNVEAYEPIENPLMKQSGSLTNDSQKQTEGGRSTKVKIQRENLKKCDFCHEQVVEGEDYNLHLNLNHSETADAESNATALRDEDSLSKSEANDGKLIVIESPSKDGKDSLSDTINNDQSKSPISHSKSHIAPTHPEDGSSGYEQLEEEKKYNAEDERLNEQQASPDDPTANGEEAGNGEPAPDALAQRDRAGTEEITRKRSEACEGTAQDVSKEDEKLSNPTDVSNTSPTRVINKSENKTPNPDGKEEKENAKPLEEDERLSEQLASSVECPTAGGEEAGNGERNGHGEPALDAPTQSEKDAHRRDKKENKALDALARYKVPNIREIPSNCKHLVRDNDVLYVVPGDCCCGPNAAAAHLFQDEAYGPKLRRKMNKFAADHFNDGRYKYISNCSPDNPFIRRLGGKEIKFTDQEKLIKFLRESEEAAYMWTENEDLATLSDIYRMNIKVITINRNDSQEAVENWIYPDPEFCFFMF